MSGQIHIDERLFLKIPVDQGSKTLWVHAQAISEDTFEQYWLVLAKTFTSLYENGIQISAGTKVASLALRDIAMEMGKWDGPGGVQFGLLPEIRRLANVLAPMPQGGWDIVPFDEAIKRGLISRRDAREIENLLVFFTLAWHLHREQECQVIMGIIAARVDASMSSQTLAALHASLMTSSATASTGATPPVASLPPSLTGAPVPASRNASGNGSTNSPGAPLTSSASAT